MKSLTEGIAENLCHDIERKIKLKAEKQFELNSSRQPLDSWETAGSFGWILGYKVILWVDLAILVSGKWLSQSSVLLFANELLLFVTTTLPYFYYFLSFYIFFPGENKNI